MISPLYGQLSPLRIPTLALEIPQTIPGLQLWLDATTGLFDAATGGSAVTADSSAVARWEDRSGNSRHHTQATANNRPILKTNQINGKNIVSFDGANDILVNTPSTVFRNVSAYTFFAVRKNRSSVTGGTKRLFSNNDANTQVRFDFITTFTNKSTISARRLPTDTLATLAAPNNNTTSGTFELFCALVDHTNTTAKVFKNGTISASSSSFLTSGNTNDTSYRTVIAGFSLSSGVADVDVAEILVYHGALSDADRGTIESYLTTKWGL